VGTLRVMSAKGDYKVNWDETKVETGDLDALEAIREAERIFKQERAKGGTAFRVDPGRETERIDEFDRTADRIVIVPRVAGG
jgi:hypothetical protein